jgi:hypothetical protein
MPGYASVDGTVGAGPLNDIFTPDLTQRWTLGQIATGVDPYFGYGEFIYGQAAAAIALPGRLVVPSEVYLMTDLASTAIQGMPFAVSRQVMAINTFGWFQIGGLCPVQTANSVATGVAVGIGTAGIAGTNSAGKQLMNTRVQKDSTFTVGGAPNLKKVSSTNGSPVLNISSIDGLFVGLTISGIAGITGTILSIDPSGRFITMSANASVTASGNAIFTYTGFLLVYISRPFSQGAIT